MSKTIIWLLILSSVALAVTANAISANWASKENKLTVWLFLLIVISPLVFITFGLVTSKLGLSVTSGTIDSLLTVVTIGIGLIFYKEWNNLTLYQIIGIVLAIVGIILMQFGKK